MSGPAFTPEQELVIEEMIARAFARRDRAGAIAAAELAVVQCREIAEDRRRIGAPDVTAAWKKRLAEAEAHLAALKAQPDA